MIYILILWQIGTGGSLTTTEFNNKNSCEIAAEHFNKQWYIHAKCFEKGVKK